MISPRTKVAQKLGKFIKTAQDAGNIKEIGADDLKLTEPKDLAKDEPLEDELPEDELDGESEEESEEEDEEEELTVEEKVSKMEDVLKVVVEALEEQKEFIEQMAMGENPKDLDDLKEEKKESESDKTSDDFGINVEEKKMGNLRAKRKARLDKTAKTVGDEFNESKSTSKSYKPFVPKVDIVKVKKSEVPKMFKLAEISLKFKKNPLSWQVLNGKDEPVYSIPKGDMDLKKFASKDFAKTIITEMKDAGIDETLRKYDAKSVTSTPDSTVYKQAFSDIKRRFIRSINLALTAMNKNLVKPNPLKGAFFQVLSDLEIDNPHKVIEYAFSEAHTAHFDTAIAQAEKYMEMSDEAFVETEELINGTETAVPDVKEIKKEAGVRRSAELRQRAVDGSLVLSTQTESKSDGELVDRLRSVLPVPKLWSLKKLNGSLPIN